MVHYYLLLSHWLSIWYTTIFYWPTGFIYDTLLYILTHYYLLLANWPTPCYSTIFYWPFGSFYGTLPSSPGPVAPSNVTLPFATGPLAISMVLYNFLLSHWLSLWHTTIFYWLTGYFLGTLLFSIIIPHISSPCKSFIGRRVKILTITLQ